MRESSGSRAFAALPANTFCRLVDFAAACGAVHITSLPGIIFESEGFDSSFARCIEELGWRLEIAGRAGVVFAVEAHTGSIIAEPMHAESPGPVGSRLNIDP